MRLVRGRRGAGAGRGTVGLLLVVVVLLLLLLLVLLVLLGLLADGMPRAGATRSLMMKLYSGGSASENTDKLLSVAAWEGRNTQYACGITGPVSNSSYFIAKIVAGSLEWVRAFPSGVSLGRIGVLSSGNVCFGGVSSGVLLFGQMNADGNLSQAPFSMLSPATVLSTGANGFDIERNESRVLLCAAYDSGGVISRWTVSSGRKQTALRIMSGAGTLVSDCYFARPFPLVAGIAPSGGFFYGVINMENAAIVNLRTYEQQAGLSFETFSITRFLPDTDSIAFGATYTESAFLRTIVGRINTGTGNVLFCSNLGTTASHAFGGIVLDTGVNPLQVLVVGQSAKVGFLGGSKVITMNKFSASGVSVWSQKCGWKGSDEGTERMHSAALSTSAGTAFVVGISSSNHTSGIFLSVTLNRGIVGCASACMPYSPLLEQETLAQNDPVWITAATSSPDWQSFVVTTALSFSTDVLCAPATTASSAPTTASLLSPAPTTPTAAASSTKAPATTSGADTASATHKNTQPPSPTSGAPPPSSASSSSGSQATAPRADIRSGLLHPRAALLLAVAVAAAAATVLLLIGAGAAGAVFIFRRRGRDRAAAAGADWGCTPHGPCDDFGANYQNIPREELEAVGAAEEPVYQNISSEELARLQALQDQAAGYQNLSPEELAEAERLRAQNLANYQNVPRV